MNDDIKNQWLFIFQSSPVEEGLTADGLDLCLVAASFEVDLKLLFVGDGVQHIMKPSLDKLMSKNMPSYTKTFRALADFEIDQCYVLDESLKNLGLAETDLSLQVEKVAVTEMQLLLRSASQVFNF